METLDGQPLCTLLPLLAHIEAPSAPDYHCLRPSASCKLEQAQAHSCMPQVLGRRTSERRRINRRLCNSRNSNGASSTTTILELTFRIYLGTAYIRSDEVPQVVKKGPGIPSPPSPSPAPLHHMSARIQKACIRS